MGGEITCKTLKNNFHLKILPIITVLIIQLIQNFPLFFEKGQGFSFRKITFLILYIKVFLSHNNVLDFTMQENF